MSGRTSKYDAVIGQAKENPFERSNNKLKGSPKTETPSVEKKDETPIIQEETAVEEQVSDTSSEKALTLTKDGKLDIKSLLSDKKKPKSKTHSLYLDDDIYEKLEKVAKSNKISVSKALNELLRTIL